MIQQTGDLLGNSFPTLAIFSPPVTVATSIPVSIIRGLDQGVYERVGGVVREVAGGDDGVAGKMVMWLRDSEALENMVKAIPCPVDAAQALQLVSPCLAAVNAGVTAHGFAQVLEKLDVLDGQIRSVGEKIDDQVVAWFKAGVHAIQCANGMKNLKMRQPMALQGITLLHQSRQYFNQCIKRAVARGEVANIQDISIAFTALMAEGQAHVQLNAERQAAQVLREGLDDLRPALILLLETILAQQAAYLRADFLGQISLEFITWLQNALRRIKSSPGGKVEHVTLSDVFNEVRVGFAKAMLADWWKKIPPVAIPTAPTNKSLLGFLPFAPGGDRKLSEAKVKENLAPGLTRIAGLVEVHDRIYGQVLQLETLDKEGVAPSRFTNSLMTLPNSKTAQAILFDG